ncbi:hypothetical protein [Methylobacterium sp. BTF04]|uniref:hypothetical protein n=1 Tax=Methylobacterium sp. BTF04 TaxID=2708300 RepID=UPI0019538839|nr:hypothetical protein [Methylobacterium sp. BTF04]
MSFPVAMAATLISDAAQERFVHVISGTLLVPMRRQAARRTGFKAIQTLRGRIIYADQDVTSDAA